jgi:sortase A
MPISIITMFRAIAGRLKGRQVFARRPLAFLLLGIGAALTLYVGHEYWSMYSGQRELAQEWERQNSSLTQISAQDSLTRVFVPKIGLDVLMVEGTTRDALLKGPGHLENTPLPGEAGNAVIAAHRDTFFRKLNSLRLGDDILVRRAAQEYRYVVSRKTVVKPNDISVLAPTQTSRLTLITCYPINFIGPAPERLVVTADRVATPTTLTASR